MFRRAAVTTAVLGAGLASTAGVALANDCCPPTHHASAECENNVNLTSLTQGGDLASVAPGTQIAAPINVCHVLNDTSIASDNHVDLLSGLL